MACIVFSFPRSSRHWQLGMNCVKMIKLFLFNLSSDQRGLSLWYYVYFNALSKFISIFTLPRLGILKIVNSNRILHISPSFFTSFHLSKQFSYLLIGKLLYSYSIFHKCITTFYLSIVRAPVFDRHQFFGTSEHYGKAHGSLLSGWKNYNYTPCCWFPIHPAIF